jgi:hypothetical protein
MGCTVGVSISTVFHATLSLPHLGRCIGINSLGIAKARLQSEEN